MQGKLFIVATPIGNLGDITLRAIETLKSVDMIYAEDTRVTRKLLDHLSISKPLYNYHQHSLVAKREEIVEHLLRGSSIALVTDAGTPGISDPGNELVNFLASELSPLPVTSYSLPIIPIPGASSLTAALSVCGFNVNKFVFLGFLQKKRRTKTFEWIKEGKLSFVFFENTHRLYKTLMDVKEVFGGGKRVFIARELTKLHETLYRGTLTEVMRKIDGTKLKGEVVVIVEN